MLREIEFASTEARSVTVNTKLRMITWTLPVSEAGYSALGGSITHGCCCSWEDGVRLDAPLCSYHLMTGHLNACRRRFPHRFYRSGVAEPGYPLFLDNNGDVCTKDGVTNTVRHAAKDSGQQTVDPGGLALHTGHAMRVIGAQGLSRAGFAELIIALIARWGSRAVNGYIHKALLTSSHLLASAAFAGWERVAAANSGGSASSSSKN